MVCMVSQPLSIGAWMAMSKMSDPDISERVHHLGDKTGAGRQNRCRETKQVQGDKTGAGRQSRCRETKQVQGDKTGAGRQNRCRETKQVQGDKTGARRQNRCRETKQVQGDKAGWSTSQSSLCRGNVLLFKSMVCEYQVHFILLHCLSSKIGFADL